MGNSIKKLLLFAGIAITTTSAGARDTYNFNSDWRIEKQKATVTLPHAWNEDEAFKVGIKSLSDSVIWYRKTFMLPAGSENKKVFIEFEGARQQAVVYLNGKEIGMHDNGVMAFGFDLTPYIKKGKNLIEVRTDNDWHYRETKAWKDGKHWSYQWNNNNFNANYGGLPKNVWLHITDHVYQTLPLYSNLHTTGTYVYATCFDIPGHKATINAETQVKNETSSDVTKKMTVVVEETDGREIARFESSDVTIPAGKMATLKASKSLSGLHFWSWGYGYLYNVKTIVGDDEVITTTGFRKTAFKDGMFYLNDRVLMVHGYAQRTSNEWPGVGMSVPAWLSDYSNDLEVKSGGNVVRWMHVTPWKQDVESCDRVGLIQAMPAGDAEKDAEGRHWEQRVELMRDAIIYMRNNPSVIFYECGNQRITREHMIEMKHIRDIFDPCGGRAIGCREMLDVNEAEYGGEMLYINKSKTKPMWMMEYCRDEGLRWYWNSWSYPFHKEGDGPLYRNAPAVAYNHNSDEFVAELVRRWYEYWENRPGTATRVNSGGVKIVFSDTQTHGRSADNYRVSGIVDPMRVPKDAFYAHQTMWDGWVDDLKPHTYICGHWNYKQGEIIPVIYVISTSDKVVLKQGSETIEESGREAHFNHIFKNVKYTSDKLIAISYDHNGREESRYELQTAGAPDHLKLTTIENPTGWKADGNDVALVQIEVVDAQDRRCPLDNRLIKWSVKGPAEWRGGVAKGKNNHALCDTLPVECGINRVMLRSLTKAGTVTVTAKAEGMKDAVVTMKTNAIKVENGLTRYMPSDGLKPVLDRGETPATPSFHQSFVEVPIMGAQAGSGDNVFASYDGNENSSWDSSKNKDEAWVTYILAEESPIEDICVKMKGFRTTTYPIEILADGKKVWEGWTPKTLGYTHIRLDRPVSARQFTLRMTGSSTMRDAFGAVKELDSRNNDKVEKGSASLKIIEIEFLKKAF